jgi:proliferating cell nuclear antigen
MKLVLQEPKSFIDSVSIISDLVSEARFQISQNMIELVAMDAANVAMVIFRLPSSGFQEYQVDEDIEIAINLANFKKILKRSRNDDKLQLEYKDSKLIVQFLGKSTRTFDLPTIEFEEKEQKVPSLNFTGKITMPSSELVNAVEDVGIISESVTLLSKKEKLSVFGEGDLSKAEIEIVPSDEISISIKENEDQVKAKYSIEYLKKMIVGDKISPNVVLEFGNDYPLKLEYKVLDTVELSFILAPRVDN